MLFGGVNCVAQTKNELSVYGGFIQLKEELNQSMVYNGPQLGLHYGRNWFFEKWELRYKPKLALGIPFNRSMEAINIRFVPVDFSGLIPVYQTDERCFRVGLNFGADYNYQAYPEQQSAHLFWYGEIGIAPCFEYEYQWNERKIKLFLQNSLAGFVSRTEYFNDYFYSFKLADFFTNPHQNMQFGSFDKYEHSKAAIEYFPDNSKNNSFTLGFEYIDSHFGKRFQSLNYYLQWKKSF